MALPQSALVNRFGCQWSLTQSRRENQQQLKSHDSLAVWLTLGIALLSTKGHACITSGIISNVDMVKAADAIVRAKAAEYVLPPSDPSIKTTGVPDSEVRFKVIETVKGQAIQELVLPGYLVSTDDFNDKPAPYMF